MTKIIEFKRPEPKEPEEEVMHFGGPARCYNCGHEWHAVAPAGHLDLECPSCSAMKGLAKGFYHIDCPTWECICGSDVFKITRNFTYCMCCGKPVDPKNIS